MNTREQEIPIVESQEPSEEARRVKAAFDEMERTAADRLDALGKMLSWWALLLFGVVLVLAVVSPPLFLLLRGNPFLRGLLIAASACYLAAVVVGTLEVLPRYYKHYTYNMTRLQKELEALVTRKVWLVRFCLLAFLLGSACTAALIIMVIVL